MMLYNQK